MNIIMMFFRRFFLNNMGLKIISVLLAFLLWVQVASREPVQHTVMLPVELVNMPLQMEILNDYVKTIEVDIRSEFGTSVFDKQELAVVIDLSDSVPGTEVILLSDRNFRDKPASAEILRFTPAKITLELENTLSKTVQVDPSLLGEPTAGYEVSEIIIDPSQITITGPESVVRGISTVKTSPIQIGGLFSSLRATFYVDLEDPKLRVADSSTVKVEVTIEEKRREVSVKGITVVQIPEDSNIFVITNEIQVVGTVPISFKGEISFRDIEARINGQALPSRNALHKVVPEIRLSEEYANIFRVQSITPEQVQIRVR
jgi:YbbR domain-containing protein